MAKKKYFLWMKQRGEGCDYTIACGERLVPLEATTLRTAIMEAKEEFRGWGADTLKDATILSLEEECGHLLEIVQKEDEEAQLEEEIAEKRAQLEQLKRELGDV